MGFIVNYVIFYAPGKSHTPVAATLQVFDWKGRSTRGFKTDTTITPTTTPRGATYHRSVLMIVQKNEGKGIFFTQGHGPARDREKGSVLQLKAVTFQT